MTLFTIWQDDFDRDLHERRAELRGRGQQLEAELAEVEERMRAAPNPALIDALPRWADRPRPPTAYRLPEVLARELFEALSWRSVTTRHTNRAVCRVTFCGGTVDADRRTAAAAAAESSTGAPRAGAGPILVVLLSDSLPNLPVAIAWLVAALDDLGGLQNVQVSGDAHEAIVTQSGTVAPGAVRLQVKENRKLSPVEVTELVDAYKAGVSQKKLMRWFGVHEQTVRAHLRRKGVKLLPLRALTEEQEVEVVRLYAEETWSLAELAAQFEVEQTAVRNVLMRRGVERRYHPSSLIG